MKARILNLLMCFVVLLVSVSGAFAEWTGPDPTMREYTVDTTEVKSANGTWSRCMCTPQGACSVEEEYGRYCTAVSQIPSDATFSGNTSCYDFNGWDEERSTTDTCTISYTVGSIETYVADNCTASHSATCSAGYGVDEWCGGSLAVVITGAEPKPGASLIGGELSDGQKIMRKAPPYNFSFENEDDREIEYWVYSSVGDQSEKGQFNVRIDKTAPLLTTCEVSGSNVSPDGAWYGKSTSIVVGGEDALSGVNTITVNVNGQNFSTSNTEETFALQDSTARNVEVVAVVKDKAKNTSSSEACLVINLDSTNPVISSYTDPSTDDSLSGDRTFSIEASDPDSGVASVFIIIDGEEQEFEGASASVDYKFTTSGTHTVAYKVVDNVNNVTTINPISFIVDVDPPTATINTPVLNDVPGLVSRGSEITGTATDNIAGVKEVLVLLPGASSYVAAELTQTSELAVTWKVTIPDDDVASGIYKISVVASDKADNTADPAAEIEVLADFDAPELDYAIFGEQKGEWYTGEVTVAANASDEHSGVMEQSVTVGSKGPGERVLMSDTESGIFDITVSATDFANNKAEDTFAEALKLDNEDPSADSYEEVTGWTNGEIEGTVYSPKDNHSGLAAVGMKVDGEVATEITEGLDVDGVVMDITVEAGEHTLVYFVRDNVGHEIESEEYHFSVDTDKPILEFTSAPSSYIEGTTSLTIKGHVEDEDSGLDPDSVLVSLDGGKTFEALEIDDNGDFVITFNPEKTKQVIVRAADMVGNESEITSKPLTRLSGASSRMHLPDVVFPNMLIKPSIIDKEGKLTNDFSGVSSARAFVYGRGFDHAEIKMSKDKNYAFMWDGKFPYNGDFIDAPEGWYWLTVEVTDNVGRIDAYSYRVWVGPVEKTEKPAAPEAPAYTTFDISGLAGNIDNTSITVNGTRYLFADFSKIDTTITNGSNVTGRARAYMKENVYVIESLERVPEETNPFNGLINDLATNYVIVDGRAMKIDANTQRYCSDIRVGDYVSGLYVIDAVGNMYVTEFGPLSCERTDGVRTDTGLAN